MLTRELLRVQDSESRLARQASLEEMLPLLGGYAALIY